MSDLLKFITCGSVDDGKSTLIGHMLYDAKLIFTDQEKALELDSKVGSREGQIDYSLLLDGLMAEREQGITIDVAYRYFTTDKRSFIVADTPGHEEYTRNMAVGAAFADLAVILVDASQGVMLQTKRHARICSLMGIRHFVIAVNKMDLVNYSRERFDKIKKQTRVLLAEFEWDSAEIIPVSATAGDNITKPSRSMVWYEGKTLLQYLEEVNVKPSRNVTDFIMPVQRVTRPNHIFRGFQGQVESGRVSLGQEITVLPGGEKAKVSQILRGDTQVEEALEGWAVTVCTDREIDISRGCVLCRGQLPTVGNMFQAKILWMEDSHLVAGKNYLLKLGTKTIPATVMRIHCRIDVNTGEEIPADEIFKNEIAECEISVGDALVFDRFERNQVLGSLIFIDRVSHMTAACGVVERRLQNGNVIYHQMEITKEIRCGQLGQKSGVIWFTGLSGSGKSTLANELEKRLVAAGKHTMLLDGDNVRLGLNSNLGFKEQDRIENIRRISEVAKLMTDAGLIVLTASISPYASDRRGAREIIGEEFVEVYVSTPLQECERRDVKGLYQRARRGEIPNFTGISSPYEVPKQPEITIDTAGRTLEECVDELYEKLRDYL
ncbi:MAG: adenylyl-sulfate kinase [Roseburia sp.]|nr:adenylyl-sulfate kinase [Roseburia sp.]